MAVVGRTDMFSKKWNEECNKIYKKCWRLPTMPVLGYKLPKNLLDEMNTFVKKGREIRNHPYGWLKEHHNSGNNAYQVSIPITDVETSYMWPYLELLGGVYYRIFEDIDYPYSFRRIYLRRNNNFDGYDFWINFAEKGSKNPPHQHQVALSGVIYIKNTKNTPTIFNDTELYAGNVGDILIFPANLKHSVDLQTEDCERITASFNLSYNQIDK